MVATDGTLGKWRRHRALVRLEISTLSRAWLARTGRWSAWYLAVVQVALIFWVSATTAVADFAGLVMRTVTLLTWTAATIALAAATDVKWRERNRWTSDLSRQRGFSARQLEAARTSAAVELVMRPLLLPTVAVAGIAVCLSDTFAGAFASVLRLFAIGVYAVAAGTLFGLLARWSSLLCPTRPKSLLTAIIVLPYVAGLAVGPVPNVVDFLSAFLDRIATIAGGIG